MRIQKVIPIHHFQELRGKKKSIKALTVTQSALYKRQPTSITHDQSHVLRNYTQVS